MSKRVAVITGANAGLGFQAALELARRDVRVVMACRNLEKAEVAHAELMAAVPEADARVIPIDVSETKSIEEFRRVFLEQVGELDLLINNAGVVFTPLVRNSVGHELHLATNHLGPFALTGMLLPYFRPDSAGRIVNVGSLAHRLAKLDVDDLNWEKTSYSEWKAYARSKLALFSFTTELERRLRLTSSALIAVSAHPGFANTNAGDSIRARLGRDGLGRRFVERFIEPLIPKASAAAAPIVHAATGDGVSGGECYGPTGLMETMGQTGRVHVNRIVKDVEIGRALWAASEEMTGVRYLSSL